MVLSKWGKNAWPSREARVYSGKHFSWSYFISKHLLTRYKFIPTHLSIKIYHYIKTIKTQIKLFFIFNYHVRAALDREHD